MQQGGGDGGGLARAAGMTADQAAVWARTTDQQNATVVAEGRPTADLVVRLTAS